MDNSTRFILNGRTMPEWAWAWVNDQKGFEGTGPHYASNESEDNDQVWAVVFILPAEQGYKAAWSFGEGCESGYQEQTYKTPQEAMQAADRLACDVAREQRAKHGE